MKFDLLANKWITVSLCSYEVAAILTHKVPTITRLSREHPWIGITLTTMIAAHFLTAKGETR